ncbi:MAG: DNA/RNA non-specific endonuclease [bacterium]
MKKCSLIALTMIIFVWTIPGMSQDLEQRVSSLEDKLDRLETKLDSLLELLKTKVIEMPVYEVMKDSLHLLYGIAGNKGTILDKHYFIINHNDKRKIPYWVAYYLSVSNLQGNTPRTDDFRTDQQLPAGKRAELEDYRGSGYDRGHNAPAAAFKRSREAMSATFLLSNMSPQTPKLNRNIWRILEEQVRNMVQEKGEGWIITGNICMDADSNRTQPIEYIGTDSVAVPTHCFKAVLLMDENGSYYMYAFLLPNQREYIQGKPADYLLTVDRLEHITGYDFFPGLDDADENSLESVIPGTWPR